MCCVVTHRQAASAPQRMVLTHPAPLPPTPPGTHAAAAQDATGAWRQIWLDDEASLVPKYGLAASAGLLGVGIWTANYLPYRDPWLAPRAAAMWAALRSGFALYGSTSPIPTASRTASASQVSQTPLPNSTGLRCGFAWGRCTGGQCCSQYGYCGADSVRRTRRRRCAPLPPPTHPLLRQTFCGSACDPRFGLCASPTPTATASCVPGLAGPCPTAATAASSSSSSSAGPSSTDVAGVAVGAAVLGVALLALLYCACCRRKPAPPSPPPEVKSAA